MTEGSVGADVEAAVLQPVIIPPNDVALNGLGFKIATPRGYEAQLRPRSGTRRWKRVEPTSIGPLIFFRRCCRLHPLKGSGSCRRLQVRRRVKRRVALGRGNPVPAISKINERWSLDFMHDTLRTEHPRIRTLNVVDDFTRECLTIKVEHVALRSSGRSLSST